MASGRPWENEPLEGRLIQVLRQRPGNARLCGAAQVVGDSASGNTTARRNGALGEAGIVTKSQNLSDLGHGQSLLGHRLLLLAQLRAKGGLTPLREDYPAFARSPRTPLGGWPI